MKFIYATAAFVTLATPTIGDPVANLERSRCLQAITSYNDFTTATETGMAGLVDGLSVLQESNEEKLRLAGDVDHALAAIQQVQTTISEMCRSKI